jgi:hypothetical protein
MLAQKLYLKKYTLQDIKVNKLGFKSYKARKTPNYNHGQKRWAKLNCRIFFGKIGFFEKIENAPNVLQARSIEQFWTLCKSKHAKRKETAKKHHILKEDVVKNFEESCRNK